MSGIHINKNSLLSEIMNLGEYCGEVGKLRQYEADIPVCKMNIVSDIKFSIANTI